MSNTLRVILFKMFEELNLPARLAGPDSVLANYFCAFSNGNIQMDVSVTDADTDRGYVRPASHMQLADALELAVQNDPSKHYADEVGIILGDFFNSHQNVLGYMFDAAFTGPGSILPREGCAIFLDAIALASDNSTVVYEHKVIYTIVHELGHIFNLEHYQLAGNFMAQSWVYGGSTPDPDYLSFVDEHIGRLTAASPDRYDGRAWPGRSEFQGEHTDDLVDAVPLNQRRKDGRDRPFGLILRIDLARRSFYWFEPVELDVELTVAPGVNGSFVIPDRLDPGYASFRIWIEDPLGERRYLRSPRRYCATVSSLTISHKRPFRRDISFFGQAGGYTFRRSGVHRVWVEFTPSPDISLRSNSLEVEIRAVRSNNDWEMDYRALATSHDGKTLFYHRQLQGDTKAAAPFEDFLLERRGFHAAASIRYALARNYLAQQIDSSKGTEDSDRRASMTSRARTHLQRVCDCALVGNRQREIALRLLEENPSQRTYSRRRGNTSR